MANLCLESTALTEVTPGSAPGRRQAASRWFRLAPIFRRTNAAQSATGAPSYVDNGFDLALSGEVFDGTVPDVSDHPVDADGNLSPSGLSRRKLPDGTIVLFAERPAAATDFWDEESGIPNGVASAEDLGKAIDMGMNPSLTFSAPQRTLLRPKIVLRGFHVGSALDGSSNVLYTAAINFEVILSGSITLSGAVTEISDQFTISNGTVDLQSQILDTGDSYTLDVTGRILYVSKTQHTVPLAAGTLAVKFETIPTSD